MYGVCITLINLIDLFVPLEADRDQVILIYVEYIYFLRIFSYNLLIERSRLLTGLGNSQIKSRPFAFF